MNDKKNYRKGIRREIIELTLALGCVPFKALELINVNKKSVQKKIRIMQEEGVLEEYHEKKVWCIGLKDYARNKEKEYGEQIENKKLFKYYEKYGHEDYRRVQYSPIPDKERVIRNNESYLFAYGAGHKCRLGEKISLQEEGTRKIENSYYTSREVKGYDEFQVDYDKNKKLNTTRMNGLGITEGGSYIIYNTSNEVPNFTYGEMKIKVYVENMLAKKEQSEIKGGIVLTRQGKDQEKYIRPQTQRKQNHIMRLETPYEHVYALTMDKTGQDMYKLMSKKGWDEEIYKAMLTPAQSKNPNCTVECDGQEGDIYYFVFCVPDIKRLKQFLYRADAEGDRDRFRIICFDTQKEMLAKVAGNSCRIYSTSFKEYYEYVKED